MSFNTERTRYDRDAILRWVIKYKMEHNGESPPHRTLMDVWDIPSTSVVHNMYRDFAKQGVLRLAGRYKRGVHIVGSKWVPPYWYRKEMEDEEDAI